MPAQTFKGLNIAVIGDFGERRRLSDWQRWIHRVGGTCSGIISDDTTHVVVAEGAWKARNKAVRDVLENRGIPVVTVDWLEPALRDGIKPKTKIPKGEDLRKEYEAEQKTAKKQQKASDKAAAKKRSRSALVNEFDDHLSSLSGRATKKQRTSESSAVTTKGKRDFEKHAKRSKEELLSDNYHIYVDGTGFEYDIVLFKVCLKWNRNQQFYIRMYESNTVPHQYALTYTHQGWLMDAPKTGLLVPTGTNFYTARRAFCKEFLERTEVEWDDRLKFPRKNPKFAIVAPTHGMLTPTILDNLGFPRAGYNGKYPTEEEIETFKNQKFKYRCPEMGKPEGAFGPPAISTMVGGDWINRCLESLVRIPQWWNITQQDIPGQSAHYLPMQTWDGMWPSIVEGSSGSCFAVEGAEDTRF